MFSNILFIGAHPDDIELGCGGVIEKFVTQGKKVTAMILTDGTNPTRTCEQSMEQANAGLGVLGIYNIYMPMFPGNSLTQDGRTVEEVMRVLRVEKIDCVFTHAAKDTYHQDHAAAHGITMAACRKNIRNVFCYESVFNFADAEMVPNMYVEVNIDKKCAALRMYKTEYEKFGGEAWIETVQALARMRGFKLGCKYAEAFETKVMKLGT